MLVIAEGKNINTTSAAITIKYLGWGGGCNLMRGIISVMYRRLNFCFHFHGAKTYAMSLICLVYFWYSCVPNPNHSTGKFFSM